MQRIVKLIFLRKRELVRKETSIYEKQRWNKKEICYLHVKKIKI